MSRAGRWGVYLLAGYGAGSVAANAAFLWQQAKWTLRGLDLSEPFDVEGDESW